MNEFILLLVINAALIGVVIAYWRKGYLNSIFSGVGKYIFIFLVGWIGFSIIIGLFLAFDDLENSKVFSYQLLVGDVIVVLRFFAVGLVLTFLLTWIPFRFSKQSRLKN
jgi:biotin transporter BioY